jgi:hypothetical protein
MENIIYLCMLVYLLGKSLNAVTAVRIRFILKSTNGRVILHSHDGRRKAPPKTR